MPRSSVKNKPRLSGETTLVRDPALPARLAFGLRVNYFLAG